jgi:hypothetical protein
MATRDGNLHLAPDSHFVHGTFLRLVRITLQRHSGEGMRLLPVQLGQGDALHARVRWSHRKESIMDAKYNWLIDNGAVRLTLNTVALALWAAMAVGLLEIAAKIS